MRIVQEENVYPLSPPVEKRMSASVTTIADNVLTGRQIAEITEKRRAYERLIQEVFDRILSGYSVRSIALSPGETTQIAVTIIPWPDLIERLEVEWAFDQTPREIQRLILRDADGVEGVFAKILVGLPLDASEWTNGVIKNSLQEFLQFRLPEFRAVFEVFPAEAAKVRLHLYPQGALIRDVRLALRSDTLPNAMLMQPRSALQKKTEILLGLPAAFVARHETFFSQWLARELEEDHLLKAMRANVTVRLETGARTQVFIDVETDRYLIQLEGYMDIGREEDNASFRMHAGKYISPLDEIFLEADFYPHDVKWVFMPGAARKITPLLTVGFKYDMDAKENILWAKQRIGERWLLRLEHTPQEKFNEFGIRYRLHDFVSMELVVNDEHHWLRMVGNF